MYGIYRSMCHPITLVMSFGLSSAYAPLPDILASFLMKQVAGTWGDRKSGYTWDVCAPHTPRPNQDTGAYLRPFPNRRSPGQPGLATRRDSYLILLPLSTT